MSLAGLWKLLISLVELEKLTVVPWTMISHIEGGVKSSRGTKKLNKAQSTLMKFMAVPVLKIYPCGKLRTDD